MSATSKIALGVASGYLLGRRKKLRLAITVGSMIAGQRIATNPKALLAQGAELIERNPELSKLSDQVRSQLFQAARSAAIATANSRMDALSDTIRERSDLLALGPGSGGRGRGRGRGRRGRVRRRGRGRGRRRA